MSIRRIVKIDLSELSEDWKDSYIKFISANVNQIKKFTKETERISGKLEKLETKEDKTDTDKKEIEKLSNSIFELTKSLIIDNFVSGEVLDGDKKVEINKDDLDDMLDMVLITEFSQAIMGTIPKKD